jgi:hypothetical protein
MAGNQTLPRESDRPDEGRREANGRTSGDDTDRKPIGEIKDLVSKIYFSFTDDKTLFDIFNISISESIDYSDQNLRN